MSSTTRPTKADQRRARAAEAAAAAKRAERRPLLVRGAVGAVALLLVAGLAAFLATRNSDSVESGSDSTVAAPVVGGDLHTLAVVGKALYVGGHSDVAVSRDGGGTWRQVDSLSGADSMGWAITPGNVLMGGHPGLYRSTDNGSTFSAVAGAAAVPDVHALGNAGGTVYLASPQAGLLVSVDGGRTWKVRNPQAGQSFMGTILVDPNNPDRLIAPDMSNGLSISTDGGRSWRSLGGPMGAMAAAWNANNTDQIVAVGMDGGAMSTDSGATWKNIDLPSGTSAVTYATDGRTLYAGALEGQQAHIYRSTDGGITWAPTA